MSQFKPSNLIIIIIVTFSTLSLLGVTMAGAQGPSTTDLPTPILPDTLFEYANVTLPNHFNQNNVANTDNTPAGNPITNEGATLGRVLFHDKRLSVNNTIACASCHIQANGFSDSNQFSTGFAGGLTGRNSMGLSNARFYNNGAFFWDERAVSLEDQVLQPIQNSVEMGLTLPELVNKVSAEAYYPPLFEAAFGTPTVTSDRISLALAQYVRSIVSYQAKYDQGVAINFSNFTAEEERGRRIFAGRGRCNTCHTTDIQIAPEARNNGLDATTTDRGLGAITNNPNDDGKFKVPSLRNIALTAPFMHDGRFATLEEVVQFYNSGVQAHPNLDPRLEGNNGQPRRLNLNQNDQAALVAFLHTLTDQSVVSDPKFSNPFLNNFIYLPIIIR